MKYLSPYSLLVLALFSCGELGHVNPNDPQFNIEPPSMLFFTVRDKIDIIYNLEYKKEL